MLSASAQAVGSSIASDVLLKTDFAGARRRLRVRGSRSDHTDHGLCRSVFAAGREVSARRAVVKH